MRPARGGGPDKRHREIASMQGFVRGLRDIWRLTIPYFSCRDLGEIRIWPFGVLRLQERWIGLGYAVLLVAINLGQVALNVRLNFFSRDLFNALQEKNAGDFWHQLLFVFSPLAAIWIAVAILEIVVQFMLQIRWRSWLTTHYIERWLAGSAHYRMQLLSNGTDNPDQRISEDIRLFVERTQTIFLGLLSQGATLVSFVVILWTLSENFTFPGTDVPVPGLLLWVALIYAVLGTWITHLIGRPLVRLNFEQQRYEADFRFGLARVREYGEQVALLRGEPAEAERALTRFGRVVTNFVDIVNRTKKLTAFTASYFQANVVVPYLFTAPYYFAGKINLGQMQQTVGAFSRVESALTFFISTYQTLADYSAVIQRLGGFETAIEAADRVVVGGDTLRVSAGAADEIALRSLNLTLPNGQTIVTAPDLRLAAGESALMVGPSGSGKSTLFRAIAGIWPFGEGEIDRPTGSVMLLPQRPYLPMGTLREAVVYPSLPTSFSEEAIRQALIDVRLPHLAQRLDEEDFWQQRLSGGEQQRVAIARALLAKPDWLFLDEATAALDEATEKAIYELLAERLPETTLVSIGHRSTLREFHARRIEMQPGADGVFTPREVRDPVAA
jgi:putative ATP-binding cassette transporter